MCTILMQVLRQQACVSRWDIWMDIDLYAYRKAHMACIYIMLCLFAHSERYKTCYKQNQPRENQTTMKEPWKTYLVTPIMLLSCCCRSMSWALEQCLTYGKLLQIPSPHLSTYIQFNCSSSALGHLKVLAIKNILIDHSKIWQKYLVGS